MHEHQFAYKLCVCPVKKAASILRKTAQNGEKNLFDKLYAQISFASSECETFKYRIPHTLFAPLAHN